jgi:putative tryptophan/tyrosine transport system substrate-binding protein
MNRRDNLVALLALGALPLAALAQPANSPRRIGWLTPTSLVRDKSIIEAFNSKMKELGRIEGRDYELAIREYGGRPDRLPALVKEILALNPAVIVTAGSAPIAAFQKATKSVPIVFGTAADVVEQGFVASLARPGGNITGVTLRTEIFGKVIQLVRETLPSARRIVVLEHEEDPVAKRMTRNFLDTTSGLDLETSIVRVRRLEDFERAFAEIARIKPDALITSQLTLFVANGEKLADLALQAHVPLFSPGRFAEQGGLLSYSSDSTESYRRAAELVDKIFKGAKPADLPVEQPDRYALIVNLRTARSLGITIPPSILARADQVIE